jgi:hypothetical protein
VYVPFVTCTVSCIVFSIPQSNILFSLLLFHNILFHSQDFVSILIDLVLCDILESTDWTGIE